MRLLCSEPKVDARKQLPGDVYLTTEHDEVETAAINKVRKAALLEYAGRD